MSIKEKQRCNSFLYYVKFYRSPFLSLHILNRSHTRIHTHDIVVTLPIFFYVHTLNYCTAPLTISSFFSLCPITNYPPRLCRYFHSFIHSIFRQKILLFSFIQKIQQKYRKKKKLDTSILLLLRSYCCCYCCFCYSDCSATKLNEWLNVNSRVFFVFLFFFSQ